MGVSFDESLIFDEHISQIIKDSNKLVGIIRICFHHLDIISLKALIKSLIRSKLEYGNIIWCPLFKRQSIQLENVQRRATKLINELKDKPYEDRLRALGLPSLKYRRERGDLIQTYKIINKIDELNFSDFFEFNQNRTRGNTKINVKRTYSSARTHYYANRVVNVWNSLSEKTRQASSLTNFKINLDKELEHKMYIFDE